jgi:phage gpG-like protein
MAELRVHIKGRPKGFKSPALAAALRNLGRLPEQLGKAGDALTREIKRNLSGRILRRRTGNLHDSWEWGVNARGSGWELVVSSDVVYARIHNFGGFTGRNHATRIKKSRYVDRAVIKQKARIRKIMTDYMARLTRG